MNFLIICLMAIGWCLVGLVGNEVTYRKALQLAYAVRAHNIHCIENDETEKMINSFHVKIPSLVDCFCPWRWRYAALMPADELELIKEYIGGTNED